MGLDETSSVVYNSSETQTCNYIFFSVAIDWQRDSPNQGGKSALAPILEIRALTEPVPDYGSCHIGIFKGALEIVRFRSRSRGVVLDHGKFGRFNLH